MASSNHESCAQCQHSSYLPVRSNWARAVLSKIESNERLANIDRGAWYRLARSDLLHEDYRALFVQLDEDQETKAFLEQSEDKSDNIPVQILHSLFSSILTVFIARTSGMSTAPHCSRKKKWVICNDRNHFSERFDWPWPYVCLLNCSLSNPSKHDWR